MSFRSAILSLGAACLFAVRVNDVHAGAVFDVSSSASMTILGISGSTEYAIHLQVSESSDPARTYASDAGTGYAVSSSEFGIDAVDPHAGAVGDGIWLRNSAFGTAVGPYGYAAAGNQADGVFEIANYSLTDSLIIDFSYSYEYALDTAFDLGEVATGRVWRNLHSHGATLSPSGFNSIVTADGTAIDTLYFTATLAPGAGAGGGHGVSVHFYNNVSGVATVPEASSLAFCGLFAGSAFLAVRRRRRIAG